MATKMKMDLLTVVGKIVELGNKRKQENWF